MGITFLTASFISFLVALDFHVTGTIIDELSQEESIIANLLKIGSFISAFGGFQLGLLGLILILVS